MGTEDNNSLKEQYSRPQIAATINSYVRGKKRMFEFLGSGIGAEFYAKELNNISLMVLCERDKSKFEKWNSSGKARSFPFLVGFSDDAYKHFSDLKINGFYNVINLDFCTFFYDNGKENCTVAIIKKVFENKVIEKNGVICFTFQITGIGVNMYKDALRDKNEILNGVQLLANKYGYGVEEVFSYVYKASKPTRMLNLIVKVK